MKLFMILTFSICVLYIQVIHGIVINDIQVPQFVVLTREDSNENINLDCDYELSENSSHLVVKWFMNNKGIYQWIRGHQPSVLPYFEDYIQITPTSADPNHIYRGFTLVNPSIDLSGVYKCLVQTETDSKAIEKNLTIVDRSNSTISFKDHKVQNETHLECTIQNIFPKPIINLEADDDSVIIQKSETTITVRDNAFYDATQRAIAHTSDGTDTFSCYITFKGLPVNITKEVSTSGTERMHYGSSSLLLVIFICCSVLMSKLL